MGEFYGKKIKKEEINPRTGFVWEMIDVPVLWKEKVKDWLLQNK